MLISERHSFLFIHIYKNAGTSITKALMPFAAGLLGRSANRLSQKLHLQYSRGPQPYHAHISARELVAKMGHERFDSYFSFAFVRNPWGWQVSLYQYMLKNLKHHQHELVKNLGSFDAYLRWRCANEVRLQKDFVYSEDGKLLVDFVGKFERLNHDFRSVCSRIGISADLPRLNCSSSRPYQHYYTKNGRDMVQEAFERDIRAFGYEFD